MSERARPRTSSTRLAAVVTLAALSSACGGPGDGGPPKGVLLISIDSLRSDHLSCYGYESATNPSRRTTPYIDDAIAAKGTRFANVYSTTSWTLPSHMALLTGQPDHVHGVRDAPWQLETKIQPYLPKIFRDAGWTTFGIWSGPNLSPYFGFGEGFDNYVDCSQVDSSVETFDVVDEDDWKAVGATHDKSHAVVTGPKIVDTFMSWFDDIAPDERFFAFVHMWDVHYDYHAPDAFDVFYDGYTGNVRDIPFGDLNDNGIKGSISREDRLRLLSLYDAEILFTDSNIERMVDRIAAAGRLDSTLVVVLADHGEEFEEHGWYGHKFKVYEESVRIPLVFRLPGTVREGAVVDGVTSIVDVAPTILDLCEVESKAAKMWGRSLRTPLVEGTELPERLAPLELTFRNDEWYRGARGSDQKWIEMRDALRRRYHGDKVEPGEWMLKDGEYVQAVFPGVRASVWDLPQ
ncbi:MAG: sulfatase, partial [Planctomycetota bacterium]